VAIASPGTRLLFVAAIVAIHGTTACADDPIFRRAVLSEEFFSEGATFADIDSDGINDVVSGPFWYAGPEFRQRHSYMPVKRFSINGYATHFFSFAHDFNNDGHTDILVVPIPDSPAHWYQNPGTLGKNRSDKDRSVDWKKHLALNSVGNESPTFVDLTGDNEPELVCIHNGAFGYAAIDKKNHAAVWKFTPVTPNRGFGGFTHGLGVGDVNADGRPDLLERGGWWEQSSKLGEMFRFHPFPFAKSGGSQMFAYDFDGDGDNDVVSVQNAHSWGLTWFEQRGSNGNTGFIPHAILPDPHDGTLKSVQISQMHSLALADIDGDGVKDIVTGKRFYAHGGHDAGAHQLPVLYWFRTVRSEGGVTFEPRLIARRLGVGTQLTVGDLTGNGKPDIIVGNKLGTSIVINETIKHASSQPKPKPKPGLTNLLRQIGSSEFTGVIRNTEPLTPKEEQASFVLPPGFEIQLVAAEPDIAKPLNMAFDARGRLWVTSSEEYPIAAPQIRKPKDTIKILEDTTGDGRADKITTFADGLNIPMGLYPYKNGVICFSIPNIWFLGDTDGDDKADQFLKLYGPMGFEKDTHGMCNGFTRGLDGWLYSCHGFNNHTQVAGRDGHQITMKSGNTFRMRLDGKRVEHFTHGLVNPFGLTFDSTGDLFVADCHTKPINLLLQGGYYDSFGAPHDGLGYVPNVMDHLHGSTAIGGIAQYNAINFPAIYRGNTFGGNVMTSRINRNSLHYTGSSVRAHEEPDFLVSGDPWFRPADLQIGPDGALYVTDFYNRIIGHYETDLKHPGRDRFRGRIWRIVYTGDADRRDVPAGGLPPHESVNLATMSLEKVFNQLANSNLTVRNLATDRIVDHFGAEALALARRHAREPNAFARAHSLWVLHRLQAIKTSDLQATLSDANELVRIHAFRVLKEHHQAEKNSTAWLRAGFADKAPLVQRAAVLAASSHLSQELIQPLIELASKTPSGDVHLRHAIQMTLRDHLQNEQWFRGIDRNDGAKHIELLAGICLALKSAEAGEFLLSYIDRLDASNRTDRLTEYMQFAARYVSLATVDKLVKTSQTRFKDDEKFQLALLTSVREGLERRGLNLPPLVRSWAFVLANRMIGDATSPPTEPLTWSHTPHPTKPDGTNPWMISKKRTSEDGMQETPLYSSFPRGESLTGIYRSAPFTLGEAFSFYLAGHDGPPTADMQDKNFVRIKDAKTHATLKKFQMLRNDTAKKLQWMTTAAKGQSVYVELVDGDTGSGYAWLAAGRFSEARLNPSRIAEQRRRAARLAGDFKLTELRKPLSTILLRPTTDNETSTQIATALVQMKPDSRLAALALIPGITGASSTNKMDAMRAIVSSNLDAVPKILKETMLSASASEQLRIAEQLAADSNGAELLVALVTSGRASAQLLLRPSISDRLSKSANIGLKAKIVQLSRNVPSENQRVTELIKTRKAAYLKSAGSVEKGRELFKKSCLTCHQVADVGKKVGPNLDGIGNRGLNRLVEDVLAPNRNVDVAFRASVIVTDKGKVYNGLVKKTDGATVILIDNKGQEISIPKKSVDEQTASKLSPMPANIAEQLSEEQFSDLMAYVLSLRR
jgi:putative heme-binding domain-containing protein